jgi:hypothetical protein
MEREGIRAAELCSCEPDFSEIHRLQIAYISSVYTECNRTPLLPCILDLMTLHAALSQAEIQKKPEKIRLEWHPDDLLSPYASDPVFFTTHCRRHRCTVMVSPSPRGAVCTVC